MVETHMQCWIGLDIAKSVFQAHVEDAGGNVQEQRRLRRGQVEAYFARQEPAIVGIPTPLGRPAPPRITGRGGCRRSATRCD